MKKLLYNVMFLAVGALATFGCMKDNTVKTGIAKPFDGTMLEYFGSDSYNWDSLKIMISHAGIESLFQSGTLDGVNYGEITFLAPTNHSIRRWMLDNDYELVTDIDAGLCKTILMRHVIVGKHMRLDIPRGQKPVGTDNYLLHGGEYFTTMGGVKVWLYTFQEDEVNGGPIMLYAANTSLNFAGEYIQKNGISIASSDIGTDNGVVHALGYGFVFNSEL